MIIYELALKLKNAGFPQEPKIDISGIDGEFFGGFYYITTQEHQEVAPNFLDQREFAEYQKFEKQERHDLIKIPTLSELIEACGNYAMTHGEGMEAYCITLEGGQIEKNRGWVTQIADESYSEGETPEESVANLWLALNEKK